MLTWSRSIACIIRNERYPLSGRPPTCQFGSLLHMHAAGGSHEHANAGRPASRMVCVACGRGCTRTPGRSALESARAEVGTALGHSICYIVISAKCGRTSRGLQGCARTSNLSRTPHSVHGGGSGAQNRGFITTAGGGWGQHTRRFRGVSVLLAGEPLTRCLQARAPKSRVSRLATYTEEAAQRENVAPARLRAQDGVRTP